MKTRIAISNFTVLAGALLSLCTINTASAGQRPTPGGSAAFGATIAQWEDTYTRWEYRNIAIAPDNNGNAVVNGVVLMPIPATPGDGTPGHLDVTVVNGQAFFL